MGTVELGASANENRASHFTLPFDWMEGTGSDLVGDGRVDADIVLL